jgi:microsomal dipeptidase-like Zn-dependent dipeptidase
MTQNADSSDMVLPLVVLQRWPIGAWTSLKARALFQAQRFATAASSAGGKLVWIKTAADLQRYIERRQSNHAMTAGFLGIEGAQALDGDIANLQSLSDAGFRMMSLTHFTDNLFAGSATGTGKGGLTAAGRDLIRAMEKRRIIVDLAHASSKTIDDVLARATRPVLVSHTGLTATCPSARNLTDDQIRRIAGAGGLIGIAYFKSAVCGTDARAIARAIRHAIQIAGVEHVALGSDFDGAVPMPFDTTGLVALTDALIAEGCTEPEISQIMGGNVVRFLLENLPKSSTS